MDKNLKLLRLIEGEEGVSYKLHKGILVLIPKNNYVEEHCLRDDWGMHIMTSDDKYIIIPYMSKNEPIPLARFFEYYTIDENNQIEHIIR